MFEYETKEYYDYQGERNIDYDLAACLHYNPQEFITLETIEDVLAVWEGERDEDDWLWIIKRTDGKFVYLRGGCDYTGWD